MNHQRASVLEKKSCPVKRAARVKASRRLNILYELNKEDIARRRRQPHLLGADIGYFPGNKFFLLVEFFGRQQRRCLGLR